MRQSYPQNIGDRFKSEGGVRELVINQGRKEEKVLCIVHTHIANAVDVNSYMFVVTFIAKLSPAQSNSNSVGWAEIALFSISPAAPPTQPPVKVYFSAAA